MTHRIYKQNPIHEALCEFRFGAPGAWDPVAQSRFWQEFQKEYIGKPDRHRVNTAAFHLGTAKSGLVFGPQAEQFRFVNESGQMVAIVGEGLLSVHSLGSYPGWEMFRPQIERTLSLFCQIAAPAGLTRIGLRYINRFDVALDSPPSDFLHCAPSGQMDPSTALRSHAHRNEHVWPDGDLLVVTHASAIESGRRSLVLDLDVVRVWDEAEGMVTDAMEIVDRLHSREGAEFERLITDEARRVFDGERT